MILGDFTFLFVLLLGIGSWLIPLYSWIKKSFSTGKVIFSFGLALLSLVLLFVSLSYWVNQEDWAAILDTYSTFRVCVILLIVGVFIFNVISWIRSKGLENNHL